MECENIDGQCGSAWCDCDYQKRKRANGLSSAAGSILSIAPISEEVAERANARYQWQLKDWNKNFRHRMDFNEYHYRGKLNADVAAGHIGEDQAFDLLEKYTQSNSEVAGCEPADNDKH